MEGEGCYSIPDGIQLCSFPSECPGSQGSAATGGTSPANKVSIAEEKKRIGKLEKEIEATLKSIFQLGNSYLVFQGVIFTTIFCSPSPVKCQYRWLPISLSSIAGLLNLAILTNLILKHDQLMYERDLDLAGVGSRPVPSYLEAKRQTRRSIYAICLAVFVLFLGLLLFGSWKILCYLSGYSQNYNVKNCFELCNDYGRCSLMCLSP